MKDHNSEAQTSHAIELKLNGELEEIDAKTVAEGLDLLRKLVGSFNPDGGPVKMASLRAGSSVTGVVASPATEEAIIQAVEMIREKQTLPSNWSSRQAALLRELAKLPNRNGVDSAEILGLTTEQSLRLDAALLKSVQEAMKTTPLSIGSVVGKLRSYKDGTTGLSATLRDQLTNQDVRITFGEDLDEEIRKYLRQIVEISGVMKRHPESNMPEEVDAISIEVVPTSSAAVSGRGIWRRLKDEGLTSQSIMRELRSEETRAYGS
ncbi:hypothetical protein [Corynebacterium coyleae]|uniref:hypothetical protein n=1 Tax=Corynebacterium coyleae TaxID=53374 RepID=UPI001CCE1700|nr:hypothetical protein [Corynebacterium coyleae]MDK8662709.1 hypothetical protein [Corynebacterium coyleae]MDK8706245.1 hypothetical protein [Corynebacterium coyleae]MDK8732668.1 hypothetical protein [Corynebacterium coyleae]MDK8892286.1 hypothetical protein [Corynebacterium coyleae]UBI09894.1 hypothetical protein LA324_04600 [Corynebacterium coyleae]